jgi:hypothetical protein
MFALLDAEVRQWIEIVAECFTALAQSVPLLLPYILQAKIDARRSRCQQGIHYLEVEGGQTLADSERVFGLRATNVGFATVTVENLCWRVGLFQKKVLYMDTWGLEFPTQTPPKDSAAR